MSGRYDISNATAFNDSDDSYEGMLVVRSELTSMCPSPDSKRCSIHWYYC